MENNKNMSVLISGEELLFESFIIKTTTTLERIKKKKLQSQAGGTLAYRRSASNLAASLNSHEKKRKRHRIRPHEDDRRSLWVSLRRIRVRGREFLFSGRMFARFQDQ